MAHQDATFSEVVALIRRNEQEERDPKDVEQDMKRVLLMARDAKQRDQMIQFQAVRRITSIWKASTSKTTQRYCAGILGNLAQSERGRLSASSCDRWGCVSHRHNCPLFVLLSTAQCSPDVDLQQIAAASLLAFSIQNECQLQIDAVSGIPVLLRLLDCRDADLCIYAAATMWNICKSPLLMLKLETVHGILKDQLARRLTDILTTPLEPFHLTARPTGERGVAAIIESDSPENLNLLLSSSISTQLTIVLHVENYTGHTRSLTDQFRSNAGNKTVSQGKSVAHFGESGVLVSRTCAVCSKAIKVNRKSARGTFLLCAREGCGQTYHIKCSRWAKLDEDDIHPEHFHCDLCMQALPLYYWDFIAQNERHEELLSENLFKSLAVTRVVVPSSSSPCESDENSSQQQQCTMLFNRKQELLGIGKKLFRIPRSSKDDEMFIIAVQFTTIAMYPATRQVSIAARNASSSESNNHDTKSADPRELDCAWEVSYASKDAASIELKAGSPFFWPATFLLDIVPLLYTERSLDELENACIFEFQGEQPIDKLFSFGAGVAHTLASITSDSASKGLWTSLYPRKGVCMKVLAEQIGRAKQLLDSHPATASSTTPKKPGAASAAKKKTKPHFAGKKLNKVAVSST